MGVTVREKAKGSGVYWVFIHHNKSRKSLKVGGKKEANQLKIKIEQRLAAGSLGLLEKEEPKTLFKDCAKIWISDIVPATCKHSTLVRYDSILTKHLKVFNQRPIDEITRMDVKRFLLKKKATGLSRGSVNYMKNALSGIFYVAMDAELVSSSPTIGLNLKLTDRDRTRVADPFTREELVELLQAFQDHRPEHHPLALLLARTGMRIGEALALKWSDIDFRDQYIKVQRGVVLGRIERTTKNHKSRKVDMSNQLMATLIQHKKDQRKKAFKAGVKKIDWVFAGKGWKMPLDKNSWRNRVFYAMLEKAKLRKRRPHDMRHTFASLHIQAGESLVYVKEQLGHSSIQITVDTYGHLVPGGNKDAANRLDDLQLPPKKDVKK